MTNTIRRPKYISFDCYGTLIHFDITPTTRGLIGDRLTEPEIEVFLRQFSKYRYDQVCGEFYSYEQVLHDAYARTCARWNLEVNEDAGAQLAAAVLTWGPHPDVIEPLKKMAEHFKLVILSNADTTFLDVCGSQARGGVPRGLHGRAGGLLQAALRGVRVHGQAARRIP